MARKKRILIMSETSFLATGFSNYNLRLLKGLFATGKYEIAEFGSYGFATDPRRYTLPWKQYFCMPTTEEEKRVYMTPSPHPEDKGQLINQFGAARFDEVILEFQPDFVVCTPPDELVMTDSGYKKICDIKEGEDVLTHQGRFMPVKQVMRRQHEGYLNGIYFNGMKHPLRLTDEHPVLVYRKRSQTNQKKSITEIYKGVEPEFIDASDVKEGDLVVLPSFTFEAGTRYCAPSDYVKNFVQNNNGDRISPSNGKVADHSIPSLVEITPGFARLLGYIISDGHIDDSGVRIFFSKDEESFADDVVSIFHTLGLEASWDHDKYCITHPNMITVECNSVLLSEWLNAWLQKDIKKDKANIPSEIWTSPEDVREQLLSGLIRGDGCYKNRTVSITTISKTLAYNIRMLYSSLKIPATIVFNPNNGSNGSYDVNVQTLEYVRRIHEFTNKKTHIIGDQEVVKSPARVQVINGHIVASVRRNRKLDYRGQVYNLEVEEDNSYVLQSAVHNCNRDHWMDQWVKRSPYRQCFKWLWMPTVDSCPQDEDWIKTYEGCDYVMSYTDFGIDTLARNSTILGKPRSRLHKIPLRTPIDIDTFRPMDKEELKREWLSVRSNTPVIVGNQIFGDRIEDRGVILSTMRNQARKLFPDLIDSFALMKNKFHGNPKVDKAILWLHTSYPDNAQSYDYPKHIERISRGYYGVEQTCRDIQHFIYNTFICRACNHIFVAPAIHLANKPVETINGSKVINIQCSKCGRNTASCPNTHGGVSRDTLAQIYNCADIYVQLSIAEGEGMPPIEAKACGIPVMALDYSALSEKVRIPNYPYIDKDKYSVHLGGMPVKVDRWYYEPETSQKRALPDIQDCAEKMQELLCNDELREKMSVDARRCIIENHTEKDMVNRWMFVFDNIDEKPRVDGWENPQTPTKPGMDPPPPGMNTAQFLDWCYQYVLKRGVDEQGKQFWLTTLQQGRNTIDDIYKFFIEQGMQEYEVSKRLQDAQRRFRGETVEDDEKKKDGVQAMIIKS